MEKSLHDYRQEYNKGQLLEEQLALHPMKQFSHWFEEYHDVVKYEVNPVVLSTYGVSGPVSRVVLLKRFDESGFVFFTNYESRKAQEAEGEGRVGLLFFWPEMERQVRVQGTIERVSNQENDEYFSSRPYESQVGAIASHQSTEISSREDLEKRYQGLLDQYAGKEVPRPEHWGGFIVKPFEMEFWQGRPSRLHDRIEYRLSNQSWSFARLSP
jgi:pyridoxamine 5'-phosphate oxidase